MKIALFSILKNLALLVILAVTLVFIFSVYIVKQEFFIFFGIAATCYVVATLFEARSHRALISTGSKVFAYNTASAIAKYVIKLALYAVIGLVLFISGNGMKYMAWVCFMVAGTELLLMAYKRFTGGFYIALTSDKIIVSTTKPLVAFVDGIRQINTRHGLAYVLKHDQHAMTIRVDIMPDKDRFMKELAEWASVHGIPFVSEP